MNGRSQCLSAASRSFQPPHGCVQPLVFQRQKRWTVKPRTRPPRIHHQEEGSRHRITLTPTAITHFSTRRSRSNKAVYTTPDTRDALKETRPMDIRARFVAKAPERSGNPEKGLLMCPICTDNARTRAGEMPAESFRLRSRRSE